MDCFIVRRGGKSEVKPSKKVIYNMPLTSSLEDISGYNRVSVYSGTTEQTISVANGLYLYNNAVSLDMTFLDDIIDSKFVMDFDFCYNSIGTTQYPQYRRLVSWYPMGAEISYIGSRSTNYIDLLQYGTSLSQQTKNKYHGMLWHHGTLTCDLNTRGFVLTIDDIDTVAITITAALDANFYIGMEMYGLNGYIKNFVVTTGNEG